MENCLLNLSEPIIDSKDWVFKFLFTTLVPLLPTLVSPLSLGAKTAKLLYPWAFIEVRLPKDNPSNKCAACLEVTLS